MLYMWPRSRKSRLGRDAERVLVIGGSSGVGRSIARQYSHRGARVCIVARRQHALEEVAAECLKLCPTTRENVVLPLSGDFADAQDILKVRNEIQKCWQGLDTLIICAGVSALRPLLEVAGVTHSGDQVTVAGIQQMVDVSNAAVRGNYIGPLLSAVTFVPLLESSSAAPAILLVSSLAAVCPPPTRALYASTKSAALVLYQALAIEHPRITFTTVIPSTIEGDFRASAVDNGPVREADPAKHGLKREHVAARCIKAVDNGERAVYLPYWFSTVAHWLYFLFPRVAQLFSTRKYNFSPTM